MTLELDDEAMTHRLRAELEGATYHRSTNSFAPRSRTPLVAGVAGIASAVVAAGVIAGIGSSSPALAWSPTPIAATTADEDAARAACSADIGDESSRGGSAASTQSFELPPLVALDLRGTGGLATFADNRMVFTCLLVRDGDGFERGPVVGESIEASTGSNVLGIVGATSTEWGDGKTISMITGVAPTGTTTVSINIAGQPTATTAVTDGRFAMWWFGSVQELSASLTALDASGEEIARTEVDNTRVGDEGTRG